LPEAETSLIPFDYCVSDFAPLILMSSMVNP